MYKRDFIKAAADRAGISQAQMAKALDAILNVITESLAEGEKVQITGFCTFDVAERAPRKGRNPATGKAIQIPARTAPVCRIGTGLKEAVTVVEPPETAPERVNLPETTPA